MSSSLSCEGPREGWCKAVARFVDRLLAAAARSKNGLRAEDIGQEFQRFAIDTALGRSEPPSDAGHREQHQPAGDRTNHNQQAFVRHLERLFVEMEEVERLSRRVALGFVLAARRIPGDGLSGDADSHELPAALPDPVQDIHMRPLVNMALISVARDFRNEFETRLQSFVETVNGGLNAHTAGLAPWSMDTCKALTILDALFRDLRAQLRDGGANGLDARYGLGCGKVLEDFLDMLDEKLETATERRSLLKTTVAGRHAPEQ